MNPSSHSLWYRQSAKNFNEALPLGNGRMGAMVYGGGACETMTLNEDTLWSGYPRLSQRKCYDVWLKARKLVEEKRNPEAAALLEQEFADYPVQTYLPLGALHILTHGCDHTDALSRRLRLDLGCHETVFRNGNAVYHQHCFISHPHQVLAVRLWREDGEVFSVSAALDGALKHTLSSDVNTLYIRGNCPDRRYLPAVPGPTFCYHEDPAQQGVGYRCGLRAVCEGGSILVDEDGMHIRNAREICLYLAVRSSFNGPFNHPVLNGKEYVEACARDLDTAVALGFDALLQAHIADHKALYDRCSLELGENDAGSLPTDSRLQLHAEGKKDPALYALLFHYGRYLTIAASRAGTQPANLQGIWNEKLNAPWSSNYTTNINTEMNYWPTMSANLAECVEPLLDMLRDLRHSGSVIARNFYNAPGFVVHHNCDLWRTAHPAGLNHKNSCQWGQWPMASGWLCKMAYDVYLYNRDESYLLELLPILEDSAAFYMSLLVEKEGKLILSPSTSPENNYVRGDAPCPLDDTTTMSIAITRDVLNCTATVCEHFGKDSTIYRQTAEKLLPYRINTEGTLAEWYGEYEDWEIHHRHVSHLYGLYPSKQIGQNTPELLDACRATLEKRGDKSTGWSLAWKNNLWARLRDGDRAGHLLDLALAPVASTTEATMSGGGSYPNLFCAHPPFQIDGNFGICAGILEMLVQMDENGDPVLLPALPSDWHSGKLTGMRIPGNKVLSFAWENGAVTELTVQEL